MKTFSANEFYDFLRKDGWKSEQEIEVIDTEVWQQDECQSQYHPMLDETRHSYGQATLISTLDGVTMTFVESFSYDDHEPESFRASGPDDVGDEIGFFLEGARVVDDDGDTLDPADDFNTFVSIPDDFSDIDYSSLDLDGVLDVGTVKIGEIEMEEFLVVRDNSPDLRFAGERIAYAAASTEEDLDINPSNDSRWIEISVYATQAGQYIVSHEHFSRWQNERNKHFAAVCDDKNAIVDQLGYSVLAKSLYADLGIDAAEEIA